MSSIDVPFVRSETPLARQLDDETVMFDPEHGKYFALDAVGSRVWELLEQPMTVAQVCVRLRAEFAVDQETCTADVLALIEDLRASRLVEPCA